MKNLKIAATLMLLVISTGCDTDDESNTQGQTPQGVISSQQREAIDAANSVEQALLDTAGERRKELEAQLQNQ